MNRTASIVALALFVCAGGSTRAEEVVVGNMKISAAWVRATPKGAPVGGGYFTITNRGNTPDRLMGGKSEVSNRLEIHRMDMDKGVMKMREVTSGVEIKAGQTVKFEPSGYHVMFVGLKQQLKQGDRIKAILQFEKAGSAEVGFVVEGIGARTGGSGGHTHGH